MSYQNPFYRLPIFIVLIYLNPLSLSLAKANSVTFSAELTAEGTQVVGYENRTFSGEFPWFEVRGGHFGGWPRKTKTVEFCVPEHVPRSCELDTSRTHSTATNLTGGYGQGAPGYGIFVKTVNSPGGAQSATYEYNEYTRCLTSTVTVRAKRRMRGWYEGSHEIYMRCPIVEDWSHTEIKGPFTLHEDQDEDVYSWLATYTGPRGTPNGLEGTIKINPENGFKSRLINQSPATANVLHGMFKEFDDVNFNKNGDAFYALYDSNDIEALGLEVTQGVQNLYNDMPLVTKRRTMARFYVKGTHPQAGIHAQLRAFKNGIELPDSPIPAENPITVISRGLDRANLNQSFLFKLPKAWTFEGNIQLRAEANFSNIENEDNTNNNIWIEDVTFNKPKIKITYNANNEIIREDDLGVNTVVGVPLHLHLNADRDAPNYIYRTDFATYLPIIEHTRRYHPIYDLQTVDCGLKPLKPWFNGWPFYREWDVKKDRHVSAIVRRITLKKMFSRCGGNAYWSGLIHPTLDNDPNNSVTSMGSLIFRASAVRMNPDWVRLAQDNERFSMDGGETFAHELGHNKNLKHVCTIDDPDYQDSNYPHPTLCLMGVGGSTFFDYGHDGYYLLDVYHDYWGLSKPKVMGTNSPGVPSSFFDFPVSPLMSYADNKRFISPYSYCKLLKQMGIDCDPLQITKNDRKNDKMMLAKKNNRTKPSRIKEVHTDHDNKLMLGGFLAASSHAHSSSNSAEQILSNLSLVSPRSVLPTNYSQPPLREGHNLYVLVSGLFDVATHEVIDHSLITFSEAPTPWAITEAQEKRERFMSALDRNASDAIGVLSVRQSSENNAQAAREDIVGMAMANEYDGGLFSYFQVIEVAPNTKKLELVFNQKTIDVIDVSENKPSIQLHNFRSQLLLEDSKLSWSASDADNDDLSYSIFYSADAGKSWNLVEMGLTETEYNLRSGLAEHESVNDYFAGSNQALFKVVASDGFHTTSTQLGQYIQTKGAEPKVRIMQEDGYAVDFGQTIYLTGQASDLEDGVIPNKDTLEIYNANHPNGLIWESNEDGILGYGPELRTNTLSYGVHEISYTVKDSSGKTKSTMIHLIVGQRFITQSISGMATAAASSTHCETNSFVCYSAERINDGNISTQHGSRYSWANGLGHGPHWVTLSWPSKVKISEVNVYTSVGAIIKDYRIQYKKNGDWVDWIEKHNNEKLMVSHLIQPIITQEIRILGKESSNDLLEQMRVNELDVRGYFLEYTHNNPLPSPTPINPTQPNIPNNPPVINSPSGTEIIE